MNSAPKTLDPSLDLLQQFVERGKRNRRLERQIWQVVMTYLTHRWTLVAISLGAAAVMVPQLAMLLSSKGPPPLGFNPAGSMLVMPLFFLPMLLVAQAKAQFAHSRSRLVPGFAGPHLLVLGIILVLFVLLYPMLVSTSNRTDLLGTLALALTIAAATTLGVHFNRFSILLVAMIAFFSTMTSAGSEWWFTPSASAKSLHVLIVAVGGVSLAGWLWRLSQLREELDDFQTMMQWRGSRRPDTEVAESRRVVAEQMRRQKLTAWVSDWWLAGMGGYHGGRSLGRARALRFGFMQPGWLLGITMATMFYVLTLFMSKYGYLSSKPGPRTSNEFGPMTFYLMFGGLMPGVMLGEHLAHRRPRVAGELLFPMKRREYINSLLVACLWNSASMWLAFSVIMVLLTWQVAPSQFTLSTLGMLWLLSGSTAFASGSVGMRTAVWPSQLKRMFFMWLTMVAMMPALPGWQILRGKLGDRPFVLVSLLFIAAGLWMLSRARRAWMNLELG